jgi:glutathione S-transferase
MKFYDSVGPNPRLVRMFIAEKGLDIPKQEVDLRGGENRQAEHLKRNPHGQLPVLELDSGSYLSEIIPICEYIEELHPTPALIGSNPEERAECRMWTRRIDLNFCEPLAAGFRYSEGLKLFQDRILCVPEAAHGLKKVAADRLRWIDSQIAGRQFVCGDRFTLADMMLFCWVEFGAQVGQPPDPANANIAAFRERVAQRPSAKA